MPTSSRPRIERGKAEDGVGVHEARPRTRRSSNRNQQCQATSVTRKSFELPGFQYHPVYHAFVAFSKNPGHETLERRSVHWRFWTNLMETLEQLGIASVGSDPCCHGFALCVVLNIRQTICLALAKVVVVEPTCLRFASSLATASIVHPWVRQPHAHAGD